MGPRTSSAFVGMAFAMRLALSFSNPKPASPAVVAERNGKGAVLESQARRKALLVGQPHRHPVPLDERSRQQTFRALPLRFSGTASIRLTRYKRPNTGTMSPTLRFGNATLIQGVDLLHPGGRPERLQDAIAGLLRLPKNVSSTAHSRDGTRGPRARSAVSPVRLLQRIRRRSPRKLTSRKGQEADRVLDRSSVCPPRNAGSSVNEACYGGVRGDIGAGDDLWLGTVIEGLPPRVVDPQVSACVEAFHRVRMGTLQGLSVREGRPAGGVNDDPLPGSDQSRQPAGASAGLRVVTGLPRSWGKTISGDRPSMMGLPARAGQSERP